jgi:hypothetical protein
MRSRTRIRARVGVAALAAAMISLGPGSVAALGMATSPSTAAPFPPFPPRCSQAELKAAIDYSRHPGYCLADYVVGDGKWAPSDPTVSPLLRLSASKLAVAVGAPITFTMTTSLAYCPDMGRLGGCWQAPNFAIGGGLPEAGWPGHAVPLALNDNCGQALSCRATLSLTVNPGGRLAPELAGFDNHWVVISSDITITGSAGQELARAYAQTAVRILLPPRRS